MKPEFIRKKLIDAGVKNLKQFGYPEVNSTNILTDFVYRAFFKSMLESDENKINNVEFEAVRQSLFSEIEAVEKKESK